MSSPQKNGFRLYGIAKKVEGLSRAEKAALVSICDAQGQIDGSCTASVTTLAHDHGQAERKIQYGLHGRHDNGTKAYPGIVARGLVRAEGPTGGGIFYRNGQKRGQPTKWVVNAEAMLAFLPGKYRIRLEAILHPDEGSVKDAQNSEQGCTIVESKGAQNAVLRVPLCTQPPESFPNARALRSKTDSAATTDFADSNSKSDTFDFDISTASEPAFQSTDSPRVLTTQSNFFHVPAKQPLSLPSRPNQTGGEGTGKNFVKKNYEAAVQVAVDDDPAEQDWQRRRVEKAARKDFAIEKDRQWRTFPREIKDSLKIVLKRFEIEWEYQATHDEDGDVLEERRLGMKAFDVPSAAYKILLAQRLEKYADQQVFQAWSKFVRRPKGFEGLFHSPWALFLGVSDEFSIYVDSDETEACTTDGGTSRERHPQAIPIIGAFVAALNAEPEYDYWIAHCPFPENHQHGDSNPSLVISQENDRVLVHCRGGCDQREVWACVVGKARKVRAEDLQAAKVEVKSRTKAEFKATSDYVAILHSRLGSVLPVQFWLKQWGITREVAEKLQLGAHEKVLFRVGENGTVRCFDSAALCIPHYDSTGKVLIGLKARAVSEKAFLQEPGSSIDGLFARAHLNASTDEVVVLEGDKDIAIAMSHGFNATGILSTQSKLWDSDIEVLSRYKRIYLIGDHDAQGIAAMDKLAKRLPSEQVVRVRLPVKDIGEFFQQYPSDFKERLQSLLKVPEGVHEKGGSA